MSQPWPHISATNTGLLTDLYELTMMQAYWREGYDDEAVFSLFARRLPAHRNYLLACGLHDALSYLENLRFDRASLEFLADREEFSPEFVRWLEDFRFDGDVYAVPEGTPVFAHEPLLEVVAPLPAAQIAESYVMNQVHFQTVLASKAARVVTAAAGRAVVDFGLRRMHGTDAGLKAARAFHVAGLTATSNVLAGAVYGVPISGTMAHSYIQAHDSELDAFRAFAKLYPDTVLLVDTYDTLDGVHRVVELAAELGDRFQVRAIRLDSGDLIDLAFRARRILDDAGLNRVKIFASGGLDEESIADIAAQSAPIDGLGVGTGMGVSRDAPALDMAYKLTSYAGRGRLKLSSGKDILPGRKQVFRIEDNSVAVEDIVGRDGEQQPGRPLLQAVMKDGRRLPGDFDDHNAARRRAGREIGRLPDRVRAIGPADPPYSVGLSRALTAYRDQVAADVQPAARAPAGG